MTSINNGLVLTIDLGRFGPNRQYKEVRRERGCCQASSSGGGCGLTWEEKPTQTT